MRTGTQPPTATVVAVAVGRALSRRGAGVAMIPISRQYHGLLG